MTGMPLTSSFSSSKARSFCQTETGSSALCVINEDEPNILRGIGTVLSFAVQYLDE
jgi:hypothetical protein